MTKNAASDGKHPSAGKFWESITSPRFADDPQRTNLKGSFDGSPTGFVPLSNLLFGRRYCADLRKAAYSALASLYMGKSGSAFFQSARKSSYDFRAAFSSCMSTWARANCKMETAPGTKPSTTPE